MKNGTGEMYPATELRKPVKVVLKNVIDPDVKLAPAVVDQDGRIVVVVRQLGVFGDRRQQSLVTAPEKPRELPWRPIDPCAVSSKKAKIASWSGVTSRC